MTHKKIKVWKANIIGLEGCRTGGESSFPLQRKLNYLRREQLERRSSEGDPRPQISRLFCMFLVRSLAATWSSGGIMSVAESPPLSCSHLHVAHDPSQAWNLKAIIAHKPRGLQRLLCPLGRGLDRRKCQRQAQRLPPAPPRTKVPEGRKENNHPLTREWEGNAFTWK